MIYFTTSTDTQTNRQVNDMATMVLGAIVDYMKVYDFDWSRGVALRLEDRLGVHGTIFYNKIIC